MRQSDPTIFSMRRLSQIFARLWGKPRKEQEERRDQAEPSQTEQFHLEKFRPATSVPRQRNIQNNVFRTFKSNIVDSNTYDRFRSLQNNNTEFNFYFFDDADIDEYMAANWSGRPIFDIYSNLIFGAARADVWRYCILYDHGGIYLDFDSSLSFRLDDIPVDADELISFESNLLNTIVSRRYTPNRSFFRNSKLVAGRLDHPDNVVLQWLLVARKGHPILERTISHIEKYAYFYRGRKVQSVRRAVCNYTGPVAFTRSVWEHVAAGNSVRQFGIDFDGNAVPKDIVVGDAYSSDASRYAKKKNQIILR
jgi:mannosyltransferase OCH1-like enzyme